MGCTKHTSPLFNTSYLYNWIQKIGFFKELTLLGKR